MRQTYESFWAQTEYEPLTDCILWTGTVLSTGYGQVRWHYKKVLAHRKAYELHHGELSQGMIVMHSCDVPRCVNPDHLRLGTQSENILDCVRKGRHFNKNRGYVGHERAR